ncbi:MULTISPECIES: DUF6286 domain-containing protein [unclassified Streptomyces]|uniref:DUF6286 domain-containing protein n=1 Tax=unclassified Streptomyces TaxID=2593676 RepID=UPI0004C3C7E8
MNPAERGVTTVADRVTAKIARQAAAEAAAPAGGHVLRSAAATRGRRAEVTVEVDLPLSAPADTGWMAHLHEHLTERTRQLTGLAVDTAHLRVRRLSPAIPSPTPHPDRNPEPSPSLDPPPDSAERRPPVPVGRPWSSRRAAATGAASAVAVVSALTVWTALHAHLPGIAAPPWEGAGQWPAVPGGRTLRRPAAWAAVIAGGWLILLALTPGHRRLLPLRCPGPAQAVVSRRHAARLIRAAVAEVPGVRVRAVRCTLRRVTVRAEAAYGAPHDLRDAATGTIERAVRNLALGRTPTVRLVLRTADVPYPTPAGQPAREDADA